VLALRFRYSFGDLCRWCNQGILCLPDFDLSQKHGHLAICKLLVERGSPLRSSQDDVEPSTPLHVAVFYGHEAIAKLLLEAGTPINALTEDGWTSAPALSPLFSVLAFLSRSVSQSLFSFACCQ
jgi:ankyrin repeat protein